MELLQRLHKRHFVAVTGSSGSGKSSLIKAGLIPRLKAGFLVNDLDSWIISTMKPGESPVCNLADAILNQLYYVDQTLSSTDLENKITEEGVDAIIEILKPLRELRNNFFLLVDQFEELFRFSLNKNDSKKIDEAIDFVNILLDLSSQTDLPIYIVITMRSDFIGDCARFFGLPEALNESQYVVPRLNRVQLRQSIEGPVNLFNGNINPGLTARLLNDAQQLKDELPLLQHALMRMWERYKNSAIDDKLGMEDYESIGGIEKALSNHADEALQGMSEADLSLTKKIFQSLTGIDENGRKIRRPVHLSELELITGADKEKIHFIINRFIDDNRCFLVINKIENKDDELIDISHESLIRQWSVLNNWVNEEADYGKIFLRLSESAILYKDKKKDLLTGNELHQFLGWYNSFKPGPEWAKRYNANYGDCIQYLTQSEKEDKKQRAKKRRNRRMLLTALTLVIIIISGFAIFIYRNNIANRRTLALNYWSSSQTAKAANNKLSGLHLIANAVTITEDDDLVKNLLVDAEAYLPCTSLEDIFPQDDIISSVVFSSDGKRLLVAGNDGLARILDKETGKQIGPGMQHQSPVNSAVFSHDNKWILTAGNDHTARLWNATGKPVSSFDHDGKVISAVFSPDDKWILTGSDDDTARVWDIATGQQIFSFAHDNEVMSVAFSRDGTKILTACKDVSPHVWSVAAKREIPFSDSSIYDDSNVVLSASFNADGTKILTTNFDSTARIWSIEGQLLAIFRHKDKVTDAAFSPDNKWVLTACSDKYARLWDVETRSQAGAAMKHEGPVFSTAFSTDGRQILTAGWDKTVRLWNMRDLTSGAKNVAFKQTGIISSGVFSPDGTKILTAGNDSTARLWEVATKKQLFSLRHNAKINSAVFNNDETTMLTASDDSTARIWDVTNGKQINSFTLRSKVNSAVFSTDGKQVLIATLDNYIQVWNAFSKLAAEPVRSFKFQYEINKAVFSKDGNTILLACSDSSARIIDALSGRLLKYFKQDNIVSNAAFSPDEKSIVAAGRDRTARVWNVATGKQVGPSLKHEAEVTTAAFSPDGKWIVTACWDNAAHLWNTTTFKEMGAPKRSSSALTGAVFSPDGNWILTSGYDSTARLWEIEGDFDIPPSLFKLQAEAITGVAYNIVSGETECLPRQSWLVLKAEYDTQSSEHYGSCKYPRYNFWSRFNKEEVEKIRPDKNYSK